MANYAIDYAPTLPASGLKWEEEQAPVTFTLPYKKGDPEESQKKRTEFIKGLKPTDKVWLEMGPARNFALAVARTGATVMRVSGHITKVERDKGLPKSDTALLLYRLATERPDSFYLFEEVDEKIAEVGELIKSYYTVQEDRRRAVQRLEASRRDLYLLQPIGQIDVEQTIQQMLANNLYFGGAMSTAEEKDRNLPGMVGSMLKEVELIFYEMLTKKLREIPVYRGVFEQITGCGPCIAGSIIWHVGDPRFFPTAGHLKHYGRLHQLEDGSTPRKESGVQCDWNDKVGQPFWLFAHGIRFKGRPNNPWKQAYLWRVGYEGTKTLPDDAKIVANASERMLEEVRRRRAMRWLAQKFCEHIHDRWKVFNAGGTYRPPDFECLRQD